jgi:spectinomycin phosphotransferase
MLEKPNIPDQKITDCLRAHYRISAQEIGFLPVGYDAAAWVYHVVATDGQHYFLKVRRGTIHAAPAAVARYLKEHGVEQVVAPLPTAAGQLSAPLESYTLLLYPWIEGSSGMESGLTEDQWIAYGAVVRRIHQMRLPADLATAIPTEDFVLKHDWGDVVRRFSAQVHVRSYQNPYERELAALWHAHADEIIKIVEQAEAIGRLLQSRAADFVLCHADIHTANLLVAPDGRLYVVDWDQPILAPKEHDLMFVVGSDTRTAREESLFLVGYGATEVDALALAFYRYEWCVQEFVDFAMRVFQLDNVGDETKADSVRGFEQLFAPGDVVVEAHKAARMGWLE